MSDDNVIELKAARLYTVSGRVQGVWFRESTRRQAVALGIAGYAINLDNGNVEVYAVGMPGELDALEAWLSDGPPMADVKDVKRQDVAIEVCDEFITG